MNQYEMVRSLLNKLEEKSEEIHGFSADAKKREVTIFLGNVSEETLDLQNALRDALRDALREVVKG